MKKILLKRVEIITLCIAIPIAVLLLFLYNSKPQIAIAFLIGITLGVFRLNTLFNYMNCVLTTESKRKNVVAMLKYMINLLFCLGVMGFALYKSLWIGIPVLLGLVMVPIIIMFYSIWQGLSLSRNK